MGSIGPTRARKVSGRAKAGISHGTPCHLELGTLSETLWMQNGTEPRLQWVSEKRVLLGVTSRSQSTPCGLGKHTFSLRP